MRPKIRLKTSDKLQAVEEVLKHGKNVGHTAKKYNCTRQSLYLWIKKYEQSEKKGKTCLRDRYVKGKNHHKTISRQLEKKVLQQVVKEPVLGPMQIAKKLDKDGYKISTHGVYNILLKHDLQKKEQRAKYSIKHAETSVFTSDLDAKERIKAVLEYLEEKKEISKICLDWNISRPTFYSWLKKYKQAQGEGGSSLQILNALGKKYRSGWENVRSCSNEVRELVRNIVAKNPSFSVHKIYAEVPRINGKPIIGHHGIQNILKRERLNTFSLRKIFSGIFAPKPSVYVAPIFEPEVPHYRWKHLLIPAKLLFSAIKSNPKKGAPWALGSVFSLFLTFKLFAVIFTTPEQSPIGLFFSFIALTFGLFFLVYSMKYYITILLVLKLAQSGPTLEVNSSNARSAK